MGSINQFNAAKALIKAGLDPAKDVQWIVNVPQPDLMRMLGQNQLEATDLAYQFGFFAQKNGWGPMIAPGDVIAPNGQISTYAIRKDYLAKNRDVVIRFAMAYLQGVKEFNAAAGAPDKFPEIVDILAKSTTLKDPAVIRAMAPNWSYTNEDGMPVVDSVMEMQDFWSGPYFKFVEKKVSRDDSIRSQRRARGQGPAGPGEAVLIGRKRCIDFDRRPLAPNLGQPLCAARAAAIAPLRRQIGNSAIHATKGHSMTAAIASHC